MGVLDQVTRMKNEGRSESEIITSLQQMGIPPRDIQDALGQAQIKSAITGESEGYTGFESTQGMQKSIMDQTQRSSYSSGTENTGEYVPIPQQYVDYQTQPQYQYPPQQTQQSYGSYDTYQQNYPQDQYAYQTEQTQAGYGDYGGGAGAGNEGYDSYSYDYAAGSSDTGTLIDIAEQVLSEKTKKIHNQLDDLNEFKSLAENSLKSFEERLKRIEAVLDQLQISILEKIGSYGKNLDSIKREMGMMQDSFGKVVDPFLDRNSRRYKRL